jgi:hypothetical protein
MRAVVFAFQFAFTVNPPKIARKSLYFSDDRHKRLFVFSTIHFLVSSPVSNILGGGGGLKGGCMDKLIIHTKAKCRHLKKLTCKETLRQMFIRVYGLEIQSVTVGIFVPACELLSL